ncbi:MAG: hypothetical protein NXY57DRAFT_870034, partial [Lentinula lateritia]
DPSIIYYIILDGTDRLEALFSSVRTQDHNRNFDALQLAQKLSVAAEIVATLLRNPDLDSGHRRLHLSSAIGIDHLNPKSCLGHYRVGDVDLAKAWKAGADAANALLVDLFGQSGYVNFERVFAHPDVDILRPTGSGYVGSSFEDDEGSRLDRSVEEDTEMTSEPLSTPSPDDNLEDNLELHDAFSAKPDEGGDQFLEVEDDSDSSKKHKYLKSSLVRVLCGNSKVQRKVAMRTLRARGVTLDDFRRKAVEWDDDRADQDLMKSGDPAAVLVRIGKGTETTVSLAVISVVGFTIPSSTRSNALLSECLMDDLETKGDQCPSVVAQILALTPVIEHVKNVQAWEWTGNYVRIASDSGDTSITSHKQYQFTIPGYLVHPLSVTAVKPSKSSQLTATWQISHQELLDSCTYAWSLLSPESDELISNFEVLPVFPASSITKSHLPYCDGNGDYQFQVRDLPPKVLVSKKDAKEGVPCKLCGLYKKLADMRRHVGGHILLMLREDMGSGCDYADKMGPNPCGWCGCDSDQFNCWSRIVVDPKGKKQPQIESNCDYHYTGMRYTSASTWSISSPCTNVPMHCPLC